MYMYIEFQLKLLLFPSTISLNLLASHSSQTFIISAQRELVLVYGIECKKADHPYLDFRFHTDFTLELHCISFA